MSIASRADVNPIIQLLIDSHIEALKSPDATAADRAAALKFIQHAGIEFAEDKDGSLEKLMGQVVDESDAPEMPPLQVVHSNRS